MHLIYLITRILRQNAGTYDSRELYFLGPSSPPFGFSDSRIAVYARAPDMVVPSSSRSVKLPFALSNRHITSWTNSVQFDDHRYARDAACFRFIGCAPWLRFHAHGPGGCSRG